MACYNKKRWWINTQVRAAGLLISMTTSHILKGSGGAPEVDGHQCAGASVQQEVGAVAVANAGGVAGGAAGSQGPRECAPHGQEHLRPPRRLQEGLPATAGAQTPFESTR